MPATITNTTRVHSAISFIENLSGTDNVYMFAGKITNWADENSPDDCIPNAYNLRDVLANIAFAKKITSADGVLGLKRYNWSDGVVYTPWAHDVDLSNTNNWLSPEQPFYCFVVDNSTETLKFAVYMCIDNNNGAISSEKPFGQPINAFTLSDGYKWKYMYDISTDYLPYISEAFLPCPWKEEQQTQEHLNAEKNVTNGTIDRIRVDVQGSGYSSMDTSITILGDGSGATALAVVDGDGKLESISMVSSGSGYTYANAIVVGSGTGAEVVPIISPINGHGNPAHMQLGASHALINQGFVHDEGGYFPTQNSYRTIGLIRDLKDDTNTLMNAEKYNFFHELECSNITSPFPLAQPIVGSESGATAEIYYQDPPGGSSNASFFIMNKKGEFQINENISVVDAPATIATITGLINNITYIASGNIIYYENVQFVTRKTGQTEKFVFSIEF